MLIVVTVLAVTVIPVVFLVVSLCTGVGYIVLIMKTLVAFEMFIMKLLVLIDWIGFIERPVALLACGVFKLSALIAKFRAVLLYTLGE